MKAPAVGVAAIPVGASEIVDDLTCGEGVTVDSGVEEGLKGEQMFDWAGVWA